MKFDYDLEAHPLQIKTDSTVGSWDKVIAYLYTANDVMFGNIRLVFGATPTYRIGYCTSGSYTTFPVEVPAEQNKIWTITKTVTAIKIECNDVEVLDYEYSEADTPGGP